MQLDETLTYGLMVLGVVIVDMAGLGDYIVEYMINAGITETEVVKKRILKNW